VLVRYGLLAILAQEPRYGNQLRTDFLARSGSASPINAGQVYSTLERLERDGLVVRDAPDADGQTYYRITDAGRDAAGAWLYAPTTTVGTEELPRKVALAVTLPGVDVARLVAAQRESTRRTLAGLRAETERDLSHGLVRHSRIAAAETELRWLDLVEARLERAATDGTVVAYPLSAEAPRRGRPAKSRPAKSRPAKS
jgi:DNA-binding PadR family transcriptional regulator